MADRLLNTASPWLWQEGGAESVPTPTGNQELIIFSEQGLYFFLGRSDKPAALPMQKWVAGEVLPTIRKTGGVYLSPAKG